MCTTVYSSLLLFFFTTLTISIMCGTMMATEGLPLVRRERGADQDILAGADFLSVFMGSTLRRAYRETTTMPATTLANFAEIDTTLTPYIRSSRSSPNVAQSTEKDRDTTYQSTVSAQEFSELNDKSSDSSLNDGVIVSVSVSSSVGKTLINKQSSNQLDLQRLDDSTESVSKSRTKKVIDQELVASEDHPSLIAEANKNEFNVEEKDPITRNSDLITSEYSRSFPASVHALPSTHQQAFNPSADFVRENVKGNLPPYHHTVIYHDNGGDNESARSVSYSTVIQTIPQSKTDKHWEENKDRQHERHERNYNGEPFTTNTFNNLNNKENINNTKMLQSESKTVFEVNKSNSDSTPKSWEKSEVNYEEQSTRKGTTEKNWEQNEKPYTPRRLQPLPKIYGVPEQNYEVDESISLSTNGRTHGVQPSQPPIVNGEKIKTGDPKKDDHPKVGYVVEGRNYRKYRLEERTSDGFIVGEYGVVNHDDGSLRGVRYTADGTISPRLIYDALMKFLSL